MSVVSWPYDFEGTEYELRLSDDGDVCVNLRAYLAKVSALPAHIKLLTAMGRIPREFSRPILIPPELRKEIIAHCKSDHKVSYKDERYEQLSARVALIHRLNFCR